MSAADELLARMRAEHGPAVTARAVRIANNAKRQGTSSAELCRLAEIHTDPFGRVAFRLAAELREAVSGR